MKIWNRRDWLRVTAAGCLLARPPLFRAAPVCAWTPQYPTTPPTDALFPLIDPAADRFLEERYAFRVEALLSRWSGDPLLKDFTGPVDLREFKLTRIEIQSPTPLRLRCRIRFELARRTEVSPKARLGEAELHVVESNDELKIADVKILSSRDVAAPRRLYREVTGSVFERCPSFVSQLAPGTDEWRQRLDVVTGIDIYGNSGLAVGDINGDGFDDLYVCQPAGLPNRLYRNRGDGTFDDVTEAAGVGVLDATASALFADFENRGYQDLLVVCTNGPLLFRNDGSGGFALQVDAFSFAEAPQGTFTAAAAADFDGDGKLDVYFCLYSYYLGSDQYRFPAPYHDARNGPPNFLFRNAGGGRFTDVTKASGMNVNNDRFSFACSWCDFDGSGKPSLYVANDFGGKNLYKNNGDGTFTDVAAQLGLEDIGAGMSAAWADWHGQGRQDLYVANMWTAEGLRLSAGGEFPVSMNPEMRRHYRKHAMGNSLFRNAGGGKFEDVTASSGTGFGRWSWSSDAIGRDLFVTNGMITGSGGAPELNSFFWRQVIAKSPEKQMRHAGYQQGWLALNERIRMGDSWSGSERNVYFRNRGDGTFEDLSAMSGLDTAADSRAFALADLDGDGRPEVILRNRTAPQVQVFSRDLGDGFLSVRLRGTATNRDAIGASVRLDDEFTQEVRAGSGFLSQHSKELFFPLKRKDGSVSLHVRWPSGAVQDVAQIPVNRRIEIVEGKPGFTVREARRRLASARTPVARTASSGVWLLAPMSALPVAGYRFPAEPNLLVIAGEDCSTPASGLPEKRIAPDAALEYSVIYRYLFDVRRVLPIPTAFLIDGHRQIRKVYSGAWSAEEVRADVRRLGEPPAALALPFPGRYYFRETHERNYYTFGIALHARGLLPAAELAFQSALARMPDHPETLYSLGSIYLARKKHAEAKTHFDRALLARPSYAEAWNNLGVLAAEAGDSGEAERCWKSVARLQPENAIGPLNLGTLYRQLGRMAEAAQALEIAASLDREDGEIPYQRGMLAAQQGRLEDAEALLRQSLELRPVSGDTLNNLAIMLVRKQQQDEASGLLRRSIEVAPEFDQAYLNLARLLVNGGRAAEARGILEQLLMRQPDHKTARAMLDRLR